MQKKDTLRLIGSYRENGLLGKRKVYIKNEEKIPFGNIKKWEKYGYTDIDDTTGLVWSTVSVSNPSYIAHILYAIIFVAMLIFYTIIGLIFYTLSGQMNKKFFIRVWEEVNE